MTTLTSRLRFNYMYLWLIKIMSKYLTFSACNYRLHHIKFLLKILWAHKYVHTPLIRDRCAIVHDTISISLSWQVLFIGGGEEQSLLHQTKLVKATSVCDSAAVWSCMLSDCFSTLQVPISPKRKMMFTQLFHLPDRLPPLTPAAIPHPSLRVLDRQVLYSVCITQSIIYLFIQSIIIVLVHVHELRPFLGVFFLSNKQGRSLCSRAEGQKGEHCLP